jgi:hypothetical protein
MIDGGKVYSRNQTDNNTGWVMEALYLSRYGRNNHAQEKYSQDHKNHNINPTITMVD